jgi:hypothetical protein
VAHGGVSMPERCCDVCGKVQARDSLLLCPGEQLWVCSACWYCLGEIGTAPRCPRCYQQLTVDQAPAVAAEARLQRLVNPDQGTRRGKW